MAEAGSGDAASSSSSSSEDEEEEEEEEVSCRSLVGLSREISHGIGT